MSEKASQNNSVPTRARLGASFRIARLRLASELRSVAEKGVFHFFSSSILVLGVQVVVNVLLARVLGPEDMGHASLVRCVLTLLLPLATFQAQLGITRAIAQARDDAHRQAVFRALLPLPLLCSVIVAVGLALTMYFVRPLEDEVAMNYLLFLSLALPCAAVMQSVFGLLAGHKQIKLLAAVRAIVVATQSISLLVGALVAGLVGWATSMVAVPLAAGTVLMIWKRPRGDLPVDRRERRPFIRFCSFSAASNTLSALITVFGVLCVDQLIADPEQQGWLSLGVLLIGASVPMIQSVVGTLFPYLSERSHDPRFIWRQLWRVQIRMGALFLAIGLIISVSAPRVVPWLIGEAYRPAVPIVQVVGCVVFLRAILATSAAFVNALGRSDVQLAFTATGGVVIIPTTFLFVARWGVIGVPLAQLVTFAVIVMVSQAWWVHRGTLWRRQGLIG